MIESKLSMEKIEQVDHPLTGERYFAPLQAVADFINALEAKGIRYCHWKSNSRLDWSLAGRTDLDLLVDPKHQTDLEQIIFDQEIKKILASSSRQYPGLEHYLGFDHDTGRLFHLHVHYKLVLGEQFVKNYHLPIEEKFLDATQEKFGVKIPVPEMELVILSIRALLKYRDRDVIKDVFHIRHPGIPEHILQELLWLLNQTTPADVVEAVAGLSIFPDFRLILDFLEIVQKAPRSGQDLFRLRTRLRKALRPFRRKNRITSSFNYFRSLLGNIEQFEFLDRKLMQFPERGKLIALVGIDGSGKSTLTIKLADWLRWKVSTPLYYLGSKQPSWWSDFSYWIFRIFRRSHTILSNRIGSENFLAKILVRFRSFFLAAQYLSVGKDRYKRYRQAQKDVQHGSVVVFDRFPFFSPLDGPEIQHVLAGNLGPLSRKLSEREKKLYRNFNNLDLLIILDVEPDESHVRKPDHPLETIQNKYEALTKLKKDLDAEGKLNWVPIDANMDLDQVYLEIRRAVWAIL